MPPVSASKAKRQAEKAEKAAKKSAASKLANPNDGSAAGSKASSVNGDGTPDSKLAELEKLSLQEDKHGISDRVTTGVLASIPSSKDVKINSVSLVFHGKVLITDSILELTYGRRYGLLGENGCGKSTLMRSIAKREFPIPEHVDIYLLNEPAAATDLGALEYVVREAENELARLEKLSEDILEAEGPDSPKLEDLYEVRNHMDTLKTSIDESSVSMAWTRRHSLLVRL